jgi:uncharacterized spore protein YtfJ
VNEESFRRLVDESRANADVRLAFGESRQVGDKTIIPIASVVWGGGSGFGPAGPAARTEGAADDRAESGTGGGQGSGFRVRPLAVLEVAPTETKLRPVVDSTSIAIAGIILGGWNVFWITRTLQAIFRK